MLPFFAFPTHFTETPIAKDGLRFLRQVMPERTRWWRLIEVILIIMCVVSAFAPTFVPIFTVNRMLAIYLPTVLLSWVVIARTLLCGVAIGTREQALGMWDDLVLTSMDAQQIVLGKWWATVRYCWRSHAAMIVLRFVVAFNLASFFMFAPASGGGSITPGNICPPGMNAFCYGNSGYVPPIAYPEPYLYTQPLFLFGLVGIGALTVFGMLELGLAAALGVYGSLLSLPSSRGVFTFILRGLLVAVVILVLLAGNQYYTTLLKNRYTAYYVNLAGLAYDRSIDVVETIQTAVSPIADQGILLLANFFRPSGGATAYLGLQVLCAGLACLLYGLICLVSMRAALDVAVRRHASPGAIGLD